MQYLSGLIDSVIITGVVLSTDTAKAQEKCLKSYSTIFKYAFERYEKNDNIATVNADVQTT